MTVAVPSTGPAAAAPLTLAALAAQISDLEAAVARLQINRTPAPLSLGGLSNVAPKADGAGLSGGEALVYDAAAGAYRPGSATGTPLPSLSYQSFGLSYLDAGLTNGFKVVGGSPYPTINYQFIVTNPNYNWLFAVAPDGNVSSFSGGFPNLCVYAFCSMPFIGSATPCDFLNVVASLGETFQLPSATATSTFVTGTPGLGVVSLPHISMPTFQSGSIKVFFRLSVGNGAGTVFWVGSGTVTLASGQEYQVVPADVTNIRNFTGLTPLSVTTISGRPCVATSATDVYSVKFELSPLPSFSTWVP